MISNILHTGLLLLFYGAISIGVCAFIMLVAVFFTWIFIRRDRRTGA